MEFKSGDVLMLEELRRISSFLMEIRDELRKGRANDARKRKKDVEGSEGR